MTEPLRGPVMGIEVEVLFGQEVGDPRDEHIQVGLCALVYNSARIQLREHLIPHTLILNIQANELAEQGQTVVKVLAQRDWDTAGLGRLGRHVPPKAIARMCAGMYVISERAEDGNTTT
jgi:hypothetical protein